MQEAKEYSTAEFLIESRNRFQYLISNWLLIVVITILAAGAGFLRAYLSPNKFYAYTTFFNTITTSPKIQAPSFSLNGQTPSIVQDNAGVSYIGNNITTLFSSSSIIRKTLLDTSSIHNASLPLVLHFLNHHPHLINSKESKIDFQKHNAVLDTILNRVTNYMLDNTISLDFRNKKLNFITVEVVDSDEAFAFNFMKQLISNVIASYERNKMAEAEMQVRVLDQTADSLRNLISANINKTAQSADNAINFSKQKATTNRLISQAELQAANALFSEVNRQLLFAKINLKKSKPLIEIIDQSRFPLFNKRVKSSLSILLYTITGFFLGCSFLLIFRKPYSISNA